jgi:hypothetical protein
VDFLLKIPRGRHARAAKRFVKAQVFFPVHRAIQVIAGTVILWIGMARAPKGEAHIHRIPQHDGRDGVIKIQVSPDDGRQARAQGIRGQRPGGYHHARGPVQGRVVKAGDLPAQQRDIIFRRNAFADQAGKERPIHRQRLAGGHARLFRRVHHQTAEIAHFPLQQAHTRVQLIRAQGVGTHQFRQVLRTMRGRKTRGLLFEKRHPQAGARKMIRAFATRKAASDNDNRMIRQPTPPENAKNASYAKQ